jgi:ABC-type phosphate transport system substrate-binding protein
MCNTVASAGVYVLSVACPISNSDPKNGISQGGTTEGTVAALGTVLAAFAVSAQAQQITGAGATFPAPVYTKWGEAAKPAIGIQLNYQAIGSGGGQNQILNRTVDFGASDAPMDPANLKSGKLLQFPTVMGAVVIIVNLPNVKIDQLKLNGPRSPISLPAISPNGTTPKSAPSTQT